VIGVQAQKHKSARGSNIIPLCCGGVAKATCKYTHIFMAIFTRTKGPEWSRERNIAAHAQNSNTQKCQPTLCENLFMTPNVSFYPAIKITI
jgi:hypothetical protein